MKAALIALLIQISIAMVGEVESAPKAIDTVGIVRSEKFTPPAQQRGKSGYINLVHQRQEKNLCVPTSASMVLHHFGKPTSPRELKSLTRQKVYNPADEFRDFTITFFDDLIAGVSSLGFKWRIQSYTTDPKGASTGLSDIKKSIDEGNPVLIDTSLYRSHTFVVSGYDDAAEFLIVIDPNIPAPGIRLISYQIIEQIWDSRSVGFNNRAAIFTSPKS